MRKSLLFLTPFLILPLASCGGNEGKTLKELKKESIISKEFIEKNFPVYQPYSFEGCKRIGDNIASTHSFAGKLSTQGYFAVVKENSSNDLYLYLVLEDKISIKLSSDQFIDNAYCEHFGEFIVVKNNEGKHVILDMFGTELYKSDNEISGLNAVEVANKEKIVRLNFNDLNVSKSVIYNVGTDEFKIYGVDDVIPVELKYKSLREYGYSDYKYTIDGVTATVVKEDKKVCSFEMPTAAPVIFDKYFFFTNTIMLPKDSKDYDVVYNGEKYRVDIQRIDFTNGRKTKLKLNGYGFFSDLENPIKFYKGSDDTLKYASMFAVPLTKDKIMDTNNKRTYIIDADLNLHDDITDMGNLSYIDFNEKSYIVEDKTYKVFDNKFNLTGSYEDYATAFYPAAKVFVGKQSGKFGLFNIEGKVIAPFNYDEISAVFSTGNAIGKRDGESKNILYDLNSGSKCIEQPYVAPSKTVDIANYMCVAEYDQSAKMSFYDKVTGEIRLDINGYSDVFKGIETIVWKSNKLYSLIQVKNVQTSISEYFLITAAGTKDLSLL